jgi:NADP-dependent aldehyde dehydrogenase
MTVVLTGDLLIGTRSIHGTDRPLRAVNPATGAVLEPAFAFAGPAEVAQACELAWSAFHAYRNTGLPERARFLEAIARHILALGDVLIERATAETGLPKDRLDSERTRTVNQLRLFADTIRRGEWLDLRIDHAQPQRASVMQSDLRLRQIPLGPVAVFGASNFPLAFSVAGGDTASALAAGCPVVVKGHPAHPGTGELVGRAVQAAITECAMPEGVFSLLLGGIETGTALVEHPHIKAVGFTGSRGAGLALSAIAARRPEPIPVYAEMSSVNPVFLLPRALKQRAATMAVEFIHSLTLGAGQFCTNPGLVFAIEGPDLDGFLAAAAAELQTRHGAPMLTAAIHQAYSAGVQALERNPAVRLLARGIVGDGINRAHGALFVTDAAGFAADPRLAHEVFGASSLVVRCTDFDQMLAAAERLEGQLTATLQLQTDFVAGSPGADGLDIELAGRLVPILERKAGRILANGWPTGVEVAHAMVHGGPYPATSDSRSTSVGTLALRRFLRPVSYQDLPQSLLPPQLQTAGLASLPHLANGVRQG